MYINTFKYTPKDVSCQLCTEYVKKLGRVVGYREAAHGNIPPRPPPVLAP